MTGRWWAPTVVRWAQAVGISGLAGVGAIGCRTGESLGPTFKPPFLAIVAKAEAAPPDSTGHYVYRVKDLSLDGVLDTVITASPTDTIILSVRPATYEISLDHLPSQCASRYGLTQDVVVPEGTNTAIARFYISCNAPLAVELFTAGTSPDSTFVWQLIGPGGAEQHGLVKQDASVIFEELAPGEYSFGLHFLPSRCVVTSVGGRIRQVTVRPTGGTKISMFVECSGTTNAPTIKSFRASYHDSAAVFVAQFEDPDRNISGYYFDITDCNGRGLLPSGPRERVGLDGGRTANYDTVTVIAAFEIGLPDSVATDRCGGLRVKDNAGNFSPLIEVALAERPGRRPVLSSFNAFFIGTERLRVRAAATDPDGDLAGSFVAVRLRDGTLNGSLDGFPDVGILSVSGFPSLEIPDLPLTRISAFDVFAVIVYIVDAQAHFIRVIDESLAQ